MKKIIMLLLVTLLCPGALWAQAIAPEKLNPAYLYIGTVGDGGWSYACEQGRRAADKLFPQVKSRYAESINEGAEAALVMERFIREGNSKLIIANSFGYGDYVLLTAAKYPNIKFVHISGNKRIDNVSTYFGRMYQPRFLSGLVAAKATNNGQIGYVAAFPIAEVVRGINAFTLGVRTVNPQARVKVLWLYSWYDLEGERALARQLVGEGCDVMAMHADTGQVASICEENKVFVIGYNNDMSRYAPTMQLTAPIWKWDSLYAHAYTQAIAGTWQSEDLWWGIKDGAVDLAPFGAAVSAETRSLVEEYKQRIIAGDFNVFHGPINDNSGKLKVLENTILSDQEMLEMDWFVEGVETTVE